MDFADWLKQKISPLKGLWDLIIGLSAIIISFNTYFGRVEVRLVVNVVASIYILYVVFRAFNFTKEYITKKRKEQILIPSGDQSSREGFGFIHSRHGYTHSLINRRILSAVFVSFLAAFTYAEFYLISKIANDTKQLFYGSCTLSGSSSPTAVVYFDKKLKILFNEVNNYIKNDDIDDRISNCILSLQTDGNGHEFLNNNPKADIFINSKGDEYHLYIRRGWLIKSSKIKSSKEIAFAIKLLLSEKLYREAMISKEQQIIEKKIRESKHLLDLALSRCRKMPYECEGNYKKSLAKAYFLLAKTSIKTNQPPKISIGYLNESTKLNPNLWKAYFEIAKIDFQFFPDIENSNSKFHESLKYVENNAPAREKASVALLIAQAYDCSRWKKIKYYINKVEEYAAKIDHVQLADDYVDAGNIYFNCGRYQEAEVSFRNAKYADMKNIHAIHGLGKSQIFQKLFVEAKLTYKSIATFMVDEKEEIKFELETLKNSDVNSEIKEVFDEITQLLYD